MVREMKALDWEWRLPHGAIVRARLELPDKVESVWVGHRLVSRATDGQKPEGHIVPLGAEGGAYRGASEARVVYDTFGDKLASCTLTIDGQVLAPSRSPRPFKTIAIPAVSAGVLIVAVAAFRFISAFMSATARTEPSVPVPTLDPNAGATALPVPSDTGGPPHTATGESIVDADRVVAGLRPRFKACYQQGLGTDPSMSGRVVMRASVGTDGRVDLVTITEQTGLSPGVISCLKAVVLKAVFTAPSTRSTLEIPVSFVQPKN